MENLLLTDPKNFEPYVADEAHAKEKDVETYAKSIASNSNFQSFGLFNVLYFH